MSQGKYWGLAHGVKSVSNVKSGRRETRTAGCIAAGECNMYVCTLNHVGSSGSMEGAIVVLRNILSISGKTQAEAQ